MKFLVQITSKDDSFSISPNDISDFESAKSGSKVMLLPNNKEKITVVFNRVISEFLAGDKDFLVLMHSDVEISLGKLASHIEECADKYDVMGLCGCEKISLSVSPLNWFNGSRRYPEFRWGCVCHGELGNSVAFFSGHRPEVTDHAVACIDGLCMIFSRKALESGLRFDEDIGFNCYDTQISLDAVMNFKLKVGCLVETELKHFSIGKSITRDEFLEDEIVLRRRFKLDIPKDSKLEHYIENKSRIIQTCQEKKSD